MAVGARPRIGVGVGIRVGLGAALRCGSAMRSMDTARLGPDPDREGVGLYG